MPDWLLTAVWMMVFGWFIVGAIIATVEAVSVVLDGSCDNFTELLSIWFFTFFRWPQAAYFELRERLG